MRVAGAPDPSRVKVYGPGVEHGVLAVYQSRFICDTRGAGAGQLTVRIRGPKGNYRLSFISGSSMSLMNQKNFQLAFLNHRQN